jgi:cell division protein FtsN
LASPLLELSNPINQNEIVKSDEFLGSKATNDMMPEFEFYTLLKDAEVIVSEDSDTNINTVKKNEASVDIFMLQVGSFKTNLEAEIFRKKLALLNLNISVEVVTTKNNEVWNRVVIGPFSNLVEMNKAQKVLDGNKIDSLLLKRKKL